MQIYSTKSTETRSYNYTSMKAKSVRNDNKWRDKIPEEVYLL